MARSRSTHQSREVVFCDPKRLRLVHYAGESFSKCLSDFIGQGDSFGHKCVDILGKISRIGQ